jgi:hypothetical protein
MSIEPATGATPTLDQSFETLRTAEVFEGFAFGGMGQRREIYEAFANIYRAGTSARERVEGLLARATPAGRFYAALLLRHLHEPDGRRALEGLRNDHSPVQTIYDCTPDDTTLGELAARSLSGREVIETPTLQRG